MTPPVTRLARACAPLAIAAACIGGAPAVAAEPAPGRCTGKPIEPPASSGFPLAPRRAYEAWLLAGYAGDWNSHHSITADGTLGFEIDGVLDSRQAWRLGGYLGAVFGPWGEDGHVEVSPELAVRGRWSFSMDDFFDWYVTARAGAQAAFGGWRFAARPAAGLGVRVLRAVLLEGVYAPLIAVGDPFADGRRLEHGMAIALGLDACAVTGSRLCKPRAPPATTSMPLDCDLYAPAFTLCAKWRADAAAHAELCRAVMAAMDADTTSTSERYDSIDAFLRGIAGHVSTSAPLRDDVQALAKTHERLLDELRGARDAERNAARQGLTLPAHCSYAPVAVEIRDALGCTATAEVVACSPTPGCAR